MEGWSREYNPAIQESSIEVQELPLEPEKSSQPKKIPSTLYTIQLKSADKKTTIRSCRINTKEFITNFEVLNNMIADSCDSLEQEIDLYINNISIYAFEKLFQNQEISNCLMHYADNIKIQLKEIIYKLNYLTASDDNFLMEIFAAANYLNCAPLIEACTLIIYEKAQIIQTLESKVNYLNKIPNRDLSYSIKEKICHSPDEEITNFLIKIANLNNKAEFQIEELVNTHDTNLLDFSPNGNFIAVVEKTPKYIIKIIEKESGKQLRTLFLENNNDINLLNGVSDEKHIAHSEKTPQYLIKIIKRREPSNPIKILFSDSLPTIGVFPPFGNYFALGTENGAILIYNLESGECVQNLIGHASLITSLAFSHDCFKIAAGFVDSNIRMWDVKTGKYLNSFEGRLTENPICFSNYNNQFAIATRNQLTHEPNCLKVYNLQTDTIQSFVRNDTLQSFCFSPDDKYIATGDKNGTITIWDFNSQKCIKTFNNFGKGAIVSLRYIWTGKLLIAEQNYNGFLTLDYWHVESGKCIKRVPVPHKSRISSNGRLLVTQFNNDNLVIAEFYNLEMNNNFLYSATASQALVFKHCAEAMLNNRKIILSEESIKLYNELPKKIRKHFDRYLTSSRCSLI